MSKTKKPAYNYITPDLDKMESGCASIASDDLRSGIPDATPTEDNPFGVDLLEPMPSPPPSAEFLAEADLAIDLEAMERALEATGQELLDRGEALIREGHKRKAEAVRLHRLIQTFDHMYSPDVDMDEYIHAVTTGFIDSLLEQHPRSSDDPFADGEPLN